MVPITLANVLKALKEIAGAAVEVAKLRTREEQKAVDVIRETYATFHKAATHVMAELGATLAIPDDAAFLQRVGSLAYEPAWRDHLWEVSLCPKLRDAGASLKGIPNAFMARVRFSDPAAFARAVDTLLAGEAPLADELARVFQDLARDAQAGGVAAAPKLRAAVRQRLDEIVAFDDQLIRDQRDMEIALRGV